MTDNDIDKKLVKSIKRQLEFYFSEGNLPRDEFMQKCIKASKYGSILIEDMLKFNKLIELNATEDLIVKSVNKSKLLNFDEENKGIKRKIALEDLKPVETRTIFVCGFVNDDNQNNAHDQITKDLKKKFKVFGKILRVDLPKYGSSSSLRGFGFVEFLTKTSVRNALNVYKLKNIDERKANAWKYFSFSNNQYNHALKQLELLGHPQKLFFDKFLGDQRKEKNNTDITAIAKKEWMTFRTQFYGAQQQHLTEMKALIASYHNQQVVANTCSHKQHERVKAERLLDNSNEITASSSIDVSEQIISGSIVSFQCADNNTKKTIKQMLSHLEVVDNVAYVDFRDFNLSGHLRFKNADMATTFATSQSDLVNVRVLSASEEREYLTKILHDKESKKENQKRKNDRKRKHAQIDQ